MVTEIRRGEERRKKKLTSRTRQGGIRIWEEVMKGKRNEGESQTLMKKLGNPLENKRENFVESCGKCQLSGWSLHVSRLNN